MVTALCCIFCRQPAKSTSNSDLSQESQAPLIFPLLSRLESLYLLFLLLVQFYCLFLHGLGGFLARYEFLPLMLTSLSCSVGVVWSWGLCYRDYWCS